MATIDPKEVFSSSRRRALHRHSRCRQLAAYLGLENEYSDSSIRSSLLQKGPFYIVRARGRTAQTLVLHVTRLSPTARDKLTLRPAGRGLMAAVFKGGSRFVAYALLVGAIVALGGYAAFSGSDTEEEEEEEEVEGILQVLAKKSYRFEGKAAEPKKEYPPCFEEFLKTWKTTVNEHKNEGDFTKYQSMTELIRAILTSVIHISFETFKQDLKTAIDQIPVRESSGPEILGLLSSTGGVMQQGKDCPLLTSSGLDAMFNIYTCKSNTWVANLLVDMCGDDRFDLTTDFQRKNQRIILCDDALYTGSQMHGTVRVYKNLLKGIQTEVFVVVAYTSEKAKLLVQSLGTKEFVVKVLHARIGGCAYMMPISHWLSNYFKGKKVGLEKTRENSEGEVQVSDTSLYFYYFYHKQPDSTSSGIRSLHLPYPPPVQEKTSTKKRRRRSIPWDDLFPEITPPYNHKEYPPRLIATNVSKLVAV